MCWCGVQTLHSHAELSGVYLRTFFLRFKVFFLKILKNARDLWRFSESLQAKRFLENSLDRCSTLFRLHESGCSPHDAIGWGWRRVEAASAAYTKLLLPPSPVGVIVSCRRHFDALIFLNQTSLISDNLQLIQRYVLNKANYQISSVPQLTVSF